MTHDYGRHFCSSFEDILDMYRLSCEQFYENVPYIMLQPRLSNRKEYKVRTQFDRFNEAIQTYSFDL